MNIIKKLLGKKRKPSDRAQLIALPNAVVIHTEEGNVIITPRLARDLFANLPKITIAAENYSKNRKNDNDAGLPEIS